MHPRRKMQRGPAETPMDLRRQINSVPTNRIDFTQDSDRSNEPRHGEEAIDVNLQRLEQAVASMKAADSPSVDKGSCSTVGTVTALTDAAGKAGSLKAEWERPAKGHRAIRAFAALALLFAGYGAALFTDFTAPELIANLGVRAIEYGRPHKSSPTLDELATLRHGLKTALEDASIAKDKEAQWMRVFEENDTKAVALSRDLEAARKEITDYIAAIGTLRSEVLEAKDATATAETRAQELTLAIGVEREKVASQTRDLLSVREELVARSASVTAARHQLLQERRTAEANETEWKGKLASATEELDQLRKRAPISANSRQLRASGSPAPEYRVAVQPDPIAKQPVTSAGNRDGKATPRLANRPPAAKSDVTGKGFFSFAPLPPDAR
jgi:hypothetical protein